MNTTVSNSSPLIALSMIGQLDLIFEIFHKVYVPEAVYHEVASSESKNNYGRSECLQAVKHNKLSIYQVTNQMLVDQLYGKMHRGELEVIVAARELSVEFVLIDERTARQFAEMNLLTPIGTIGLLVVAKQRKIIKNVKVYLDNLMSKGFRIKKEMYLDILRDLGEI